MLPYSYLQPTQICTLKIKVLGYLLQLGRLLFLIMILFKGLHLFSSKTPMLRAEYKTKRKQTIKIVIRMGTQKSINIVKDP